MGSVREFLVGDAERMPDWLSRHSRGAPFDRAAFLGSRIIYYPGHGLDGHPVKLFGASRAAHCFVYADYKIEWNDIQASLTLGRPSPHFRGYSLLDDIRLAESDLVPRGWRPTLSGTGTLPVRHDAVAPFGHLAILERAQVFDDSHGPSRLAFLFLGADGIATYDALFCQRDSVQAPYAVLLQDHAFGGNYDRFGAGGLMERIATTAAVFPRWLLVAEGTEPWAGYSAVPGVDPSVGGVHATPRSLFGRRA
ncbi:MAG: hypothetical protein IT377_13240 [Polyangiaceae bacterium]|nr:hypothetical protein [Polyangiaceae bacterium]